MPLPRADLEEVGFTSLREAGPVALLRLDLRGLITVPAQEESLLERVVGELAERRAKRVPT